MIDALAVYKDPKGEIEVEAPQQPDRRTRPSNSAARWARWSAWASPGRRAWRPGPRWARSRRPGGRVRVFDDGQAWDVLAEIPDDSAAALLLIEHHWAVPLRDAIARCRRVPDQ